MVAALFVIGTKNAIISVFNLIVLYILVAFYLIYIGITYLGISYIIVYIGAIAILFLFVIMMIDIEVVEKKNNNYLPLLFFLLGGFLLTLKNIFYNLGIVKIKSLLYNNNNNLLVSEQKGILFNVNPRSLLNNNHNTLNSNYYNYNSSDAKFFDQLISNNNLLDSSLINNKFDIVENYSPDNQNSFINNIDFKDTDFGLFDLSSQIYNTHYLLIIPDWNSALSNVTQITGIGDVLYTVYHSYIYIVSVILLLGMIGAIILTADHNHHTKVITIEKPSDYDEEAYKDPENDQNINKDYHYNQKNNKNHIDNNKPKSSNLFSPLFILSELLFKFVNKKMNENNINNFQSKILSLSGIGIYPFFDILNNDNNYSEGIADTFIYYAISNIIIGLLLLIINSTFSLSVKYLEKGGGFECGFTSFVQTRERFHIIFYRVSLLFLIFDLEIILAFPFPALYQKDENMSKNNVLAFLYILVVGFIYELKEGALNIVKTPHYNDINFN